MLASIMAVMMHELSISVTRGRVPQDSGIIAKDLGAIEPTSSSSKG